MPRMLMKGTEAIAEAAIQAGCRYFFGYPITPQNEIPEYMSAHLPEVGGLYTQSESEVASINMIMGAASTGYRVMTTSSSPGISLMAEGMSYISFSEVPAVVVNVSRGGPGLGNILPSQADYSQATKGAGHGDYNVIVLAPNNLQESVDLTQDAFELSQKYRILTMILSDGFMGQMMEAVEINPRKAEDPLVNKDWGLGFMKERGKSHIALSMHLDPDKLEEHNAHLQAKYAKIKENEQRWEHYMMDGAELVVSAYGTTSRICSSAILNLRKQGHKVGMVRPITVWPFPVKGFENLPKSVKKILDIEMSASFQMADDVRLATGCGIPVETFGRSGGYAPSVKEVEDACVKALKN
ncbi:MAG: 3-methyl-2-oxobutanoate dehydrogenase subunit VorB [Synergistaceae bacterium]|nr:3-methyl-2-oxobutanoate dehydrogenase subunit VorB [Synergistaceae bacterium]